MFDEPVRKNTYLQPSCVRISTVTYYCAFHLDSDDVLIQFGCHQCIAKGLPIGGRVQTVYMQQYVPDWNTVVGTHMPFIGTRLVKDDHRPGRPRSERHEGNLETVDEVFIQSYAISFGQTLCNLSNESCIRTKSSCFQLFYCSFTQPCLHVCNLA